MMIQQQLLSLPKIPPRQLLFITVPPCMSGRNSPPCYYSMGACQKGDRNLQIFAEVCLTSAPRRAIIKRPIRHYKINEHASLRQERRHAPSGCG